MIPVEGSLLKRIIWEIVSKAVLRPWRISTGNSQLPWGNDDSYQGCFYSMKEAETRLELFIKVIVRQVDMNLRCSCFLKDFR